MTNEYATVTQVVEYLQALGTTIDRGNNTLLENIGTGDNAKTKFMLDQEGYIADTLTLYYGSSEDDAIQNSQTLTVTTHYTIDNQTGVITLTGAGVTLLGTNILFADYKYNKLQTPNDTVQNVLDRAAGWVEEYCNTLWTDGTAETPNWEKVTDEQHYGEGFSQRHYFVNLRPIVNITATVDGEVSSGASTITVVSTDGFPSSGTLGVGKQKILYTGKTSTTFTGVTGVTATIADAATLRPFVVEASTTPDGDAPTYDILEYDTDYNVEFTSGRVYLSKDSPYANNDVAYELTPPKGVPNRFRVSYLRGYDTIPAEITQAVISQTVSLMNSQAISRALIDGIDGFSPRANDVLKDDVKNILSEHKLMLIGRPN